MTKVSLIIYQLANMYKLYDIVQRNFYVIIHAHANVLRLISFTVHLIFNNL